MNKYIKFLLFPMMLLGVNGNSCYSMEQCTEDVNKQISAMTQSLNEKYRKLLSQFKEVRPSRFAMYYETTFYGRSCLISDIRKADSAFSEALEFLLKNTSDCYFSMLQMIQCILYNYIPGRSYNVQNTLISDSGENYQLYYDKNTKQSPPITLQHLAYHYANTILAFYIVLHEKVENILRSDSLDYRMKALTDIILQDIVYHMQKLKEWRKQISVLKENLSKLDNGKSMEACYESWFKDACKNFDTYVNLNNRLLNGRYLHAVLKYLKAEYK